MAMAEYTIEITETLRTQISVDAESPEAAEEKVRQDYRDGDIVLDASDYAGVDFRIVTD
jgi:DpnD/PcfM-like protein